MSADMSNERIVCCTFDHSLALCLVRTALLSSAYSAPINEPIDVPPTMSIGIPASSIAFITPTCEQPLQERKRKRLKDAQDEEKDLIFDWAKKMTYFPEGATLYIYCAIFLQFHTQCFSLHNTA